jgi:hypothetical protein
VKKTGVQFSGKFSSRVVSCAKRERALFTAVPQYLSPDNLSEGRYHFGTMLSRSTFSRPPTGGVVFDNILA